MSKRYQKPDFNFSTEVSTYSMCLLLFGFAIIYYQFRHITLFIICALILIFTDKKRIFPKAKLSTTDKFDNIPFNLAQFEKNVRTYYFNIFRAICGRTHLQEQEQSRCSTEIIKSEIFEKFHYKLLDLFQNSFKDYI
jgi:hypothetical protein